MAASRQTSQPTPILGGISPDHFMRVHWQRRPLAVRGAIEAPEALLSRRRLFDLADTDGVESRLVVCADDRWSLRHGPFPRRGLPPLRQPAWTLLVQGVDLHVAAIHALLCRFRFVGDARLDDAMVSFASDGGGVGPHVDSYDVFLVQLAGRRRWRVAPVGATARTRTRDDVPLRMLADFRSHREFVLDAGDLLYLPPGWGHDGVAEGMCMTCSIGFRAPDAAGLAAELLQRLGDGTRDASSHASTPARYTDPGRAAADTPARISTPLARYAGAAVAAALADRAIHRALGEWLSEPKASTWFEGQVTPPAARPVGGAVVLDRRTRMLYDDRTVYINGESVPSVPGVALLRRLADRRRLEATELRGLDRATRALLRLWCKAGWSHVDDGGGVMA